MNHNCAKFSEVEVFVLNPV